MNYVRCNGIAYYSSYCEMEHGQGSEKVQKISTQSEFLAKSNIGWPRDDF